MNSLVFLTTRRIKNGILRSFSAPVRGMMTVLVIGYFLFALAAFIFGKTRLPQSITGFPDLDIRISTAVMMVAHLLLFAIALPPPKYTILILSENDIANLYPAPQNTWRTIRFFLFTRSFPFLFLFYSLFSFYIFKFLRMLLPMSSSSGGWKESMDLAAYVCMIILSLSTVLFWRLVIDIRREFGLIHKFAFRFCVFVIFITLTASLSWHIHEAVQSGLHPLLGVATAIEVFPLQFLLFPFRAYAQLLLGNASILLLGFSAVFWGGLAITGYRALRLQEPHLYDYAARVTAVRVQMAERMRNPAAAIKQRGGKKKQSFGHPPFWRFFHPRNAWAIAWKEGIVAWRSYGLLTKGLLTVFIFAVVGFWIFTLVRPIPLSEKLFRRLSLIGLFMILMPYSTSSIMIYSEALRKAEVQKPLPVSSLQAVSMHILQWTMMTCVVIVLPYVVAAVLFSAYWQSIIFSAVVGCTFSYVFNASFFVIVLFNPDLQDPIQRMYAPLFGLVLSAVVSIPAVLVLILGFFFHFPLWVILLITVSCNLAVSKVLHYFASRKYENFVFSE